MSLNRGVDMKILLSIVDQIIKSLAIDKETKMKRKNYSV